MSSQASGPSPRIDPTGSASAENRRSDPHTRCTELDRRLEIARHAHRQFLQPALPGKPCEKREMRAGILVRRRDAHQPDDGEAEFIPAEIGRASWRERVCQYV